LIVFEYAMNDPAASGGVSRGIWMMGAASGGESDPSERPEAHYLIVPEKYHSTNGLLAARLKKLLNG
jgi:hypothetical protein